MFGRNAKADKPIASFSTSGPMGKHIELYADRITFADETYPLTGVVASYEKSNMLQRGLLAVEGPEFAWTRSPGNGENGKVRKFVVAVNLAVRLAAR